LFLTIVTFYLNCAESVVLAHPFRTLATFPVCSSVLSCWANRTPSQPSSSTFVHSCSWLFARDTHCLLGPVSMLTFALSALYLICDCTISSPRRRRYRHLQLFFCYQLEYFSIHSTDAFTQATLMKLQNSFKHQHLVDLIQVYSLTSWSGTSNALLITLCMMILGLQSFSSSLHVIMML